MACLLPRHHLVEGYRHIHMRLDGSPVTLPIAYNARRQANDTPSSPPHTWLLSLSPTFYTTTALYPTPAYPHISAPCAFPPSRSRYSLSPCQAPPTASSTAPTTHARPSRRTHSLPAALWISSGVRVSHRYRHRHRTYRWSVRLLFRSFLSAPLAVHLGSVTVHVPWQLSGRHASAAVGRICLIVYFFQCISWSGADARWGSMTENPRCDVDCKSQCTDAQKALQDASQAEDAVVCEARCNRTCGNRGTSP